MARSKALETDEVGSTTIGPNIQVDGRISGEEDLRIEGRVDGAISLTETLYVDANGVVTRSGYAFAIFLPDTTAAGVTAGIAEAANGGADATNFPDPDNNEILWACYAWPLDYQKTGNRAFFINQEGDLLQMNNRLAAPYDGAAAGPAFDAAFSVAGDMASALGINGVAAQDGGTWTAVQ